MTEQELRELEECEKRTTPGAWFWDRITGSVIIPDEAVIAECMHDDNGIYIVRARQAIPALIAEVRALSLLLKQMLPLMDQVDPAPYLSGEDCEELESLTAAAKRCLGIIAQAP
ncbi:MAG: hypothetical protein IMY86_14010 [Chloroflexi bacterium]|nr:hypothetical protein [Chloroflexota bacterium]